MKSFKSLVMKMWLMAMALPSGLSYKEFEGLMWDVVDHVQHPWQLSTPRQIGRGFPRRRSHGGGGGVSISGWVAGLIGVLFLVYLALNLISTFAPTIGNLTYSGGGMGSTIFSLVQTWFLPLALIGLLIYVVAHFLGKGR